MASVIRSVVGNFAQKYAQTFFVRSCNINIKQRLCFHNSALLYVKGQELRMPSLSPTMSEGTIVKWLKKEGDRVAPGDVLCEIQTDKAVMSFETEEEGILAKILMPDDSKDVKVGTLIALLVEEGEDWKSVEIPSSSGSPAASVAAAASEAPSTATGPAAANLVGYGPSVRYLLEQYNITADQVTPTGHRNKLLKADVLKYIEANKLQPVPLKVVAPPSVSRAAAPTPAAKLPSTPMPAKKAGTGYVDIEVTGMRRTIAKRLTESKTQIPHAYGSVNCKIDKVMAIRKQMAADGVKLSVNDFIIKAVALALRQCPKVNTLWTNDQAVHTPNVDVSIAVSTPTGLITPIVVDAARKSLEEISQDVKNLAAKARDGKLQLHEFQGGSFTISNLGMFGVKEFSAIINPPQCGILAVGGGQLELGIDGKPATTMTATLSYDRRAIDDVEAAEFLETIKAMLEEPTLLTLGGRESLRAKLSV